MTDWAQAAHWLWYEITFDARICDDPCLNDVIAGSPAFQTGCAGLFHEDLLNPQKDCHYTNSVANTVHIDRHVTGSEVFSQH